MRPLLLLLSAFTLASPAPAAELANDHRCAKPLINQATRKMERLFPKGAKLIFSVTSLQEDVPGTYLARVRVEASEVLDGEAIYYTLSMRVVNEKTCAAQTTQLDQSVTDLMRSDDYVPCAEDDECLRAKLAAHERMKDDLRKSNN